MKMIVALCDENDGIGRDNALLWNIPQDMKRFAQLTKDCVVVMGHKTYLSIPEEKRPLKKRLNIVISNRYDDLQKENADSSNLIYCSVDMIQDILESVKDRFATCYYIGGQSIYEKFIDKVDVIHITRIHKYFECDRFFPSNYNSDFMIYERSQKIWSYREQCYYVFENWGRIK